MKRARNPIVLTGLVLSALSANASDVLSPSERTMTLAMAVTSAKTEDAVATDAPPSLTQSIFGFDDEIEPNDPETRAGIEKAKQESGASAAPAAAPATDEAPRTESL